MSVCAGVISELPDAWALLQQLQVIPRPVYTDVVFCAFHDLLTERDDGQVGCQRTARCLNVTAAAAGDHLQVTECCFGVLWNCQYRRVTVIITVMAWIICWIGG
jgi:hypothetical protein